MTKKLIAIFTIALLPSLAFANENIGGCGWGSKLMQGNQGIAPQVLAATTNGTFGNQTFGITSGTSGCTQDGVVHSNWKTAAFIDGNMNKLARDMAVGQGETLDSLASLLGMNDTHKAIFFKTTKESFARIFTSSSATSQEVVASLEQVMTENSELAGYSTRI